MPEEPMDPLITEALVEHCFFSHFSHLGRDFVLGVKIMSPSLECLEFLLSSSDDQGGSLMAKRLLLSSSMTCSVASHHSPVHFSLKEIT